MKKVCILTSVHPVFDTRIFYKEAQTLAKAGYDVTLIVQHDKNEVIDRIKIIALSKPKNRFYRILFLTRRVYKLALEQKADIYHFHDPELLPWMVRLKNKTEAKIIYDVHEDVPQDILSKHWIPKILRNPLSKIVDFYEKKVAKRTDFIIVVNPLIKENFESRGIKNIQVISNYPISEKFKEVKEIKNNYFDQKEKKTRLIFVGGLSEESGIKEIVEAVEFLKGKAELLLVGSFEDKKLEREVKEKSEFGVKFIGRVPHKRVFYYLNQADIGMVCFRPLPNYINTGFGSNKLFEYMGVGLPVIVSDFPELKKIVEGNRCGICVNPLEPKEIAKAVEYLIEHPEEAKEMGENGRKAVLEKYNWENESKKLLKVYETLCAE